MFGRVYCLAALSAIRFAPINSLVGISHLFSDFSALSKRPWSNLRITDSPLQEILSSTLTSIIHTLLATL